MTDDAATVAGAAGFQGTAPMDMEFFEERVLGEGQGAYGTMLDNQGMAPVDVTGSDKGDTNVFGALCFVQNKEGEPKGADLMMVGKVHIKRIKNRNLWPEAPEGFTQIKLLDMATMPTASDRTTSLFTEADYTVSRKEPGVATLTDIPEEEWADKGVGGLSIRRHAIADSPRGGRFYITAIPANIGQAELLGCTIMSEDYPGITICDGSWAWDSPEDSEEGQGVGLGHKPYIRVEGPDTEGLIGATLAHTSVIHERCRSIMHFGGPPNAAKNAAGWRAKVDAGKETWKVDFVHKKKRYPPPRNAAPTAKNVAPTPGRRASAGTTPSRGESRNSLTNPHDRRGTDAGLGGGEIRLSLGFS